MEQIPVNGDKVSLKDPLDLENNISLNELYLRLSDHNQLQYPAPYEKVDDIEQHCKLADKLYLTKKEYRSYQNKLRTYDRLTLKIKKDLQIAKLNKKMDKKYELDITLICAMYKIIKDRTDYRHVVIVRMEQRAGIKNRKLESQVLKHLKE